MQMDEKPIVATADGVRLRAVRREDLSWMAEVLCDPVLLGEHNWGGVPRLQSQVESELGVSFERDGFIGADRGKLIVELDDGTRIGDVSWRTEQWGPSTGSRCPAFGIALLPPFRGHGYGTTAQRLLVDHLFARDTSVNRVQSDTAADNPAEQRALEKVGMVEEGTVRQAELRAGRYHDHILYSMLRPEWEAKADSAHSP